MRLIVETDIGHDPDDLLTLCWLVAAGVEIAAICVAPGDRDQLAVARFVCDQLGLKVPIGAAKMGRDKMSSGGIHYDLLGRYGASRTGEADGLGFDVIQRVARPGDEFFIIGPCTSVGTYLGVTPGSPVSRATMQGGFVPYSIHRPQVTLSDFEGKEWIGTFNLNGDRKAAGSLLAASGLFRQFVGKNVCHTIQLNRAMLDTFGAPKCRAAELFMEASRLYLERHEFKKLHDPTAAVCHLHPEIGQWLKGHPIKRQDGWTTQVSGPGTPSDYVLADIDREALWQHLWRWA